MRRLWTTREVSAPAATVWALLVDPDRWPDWGPTVRSAEVRGPSLARGSRGRVQTALGFWLPFEITQFEEGRAWSWKVAGVEATDHAVTTVDERTSRVAIGVPWPALPYLAVCALGLRRLDRLARAES